MNTISFLSIIVPALAVLLAPIFSYWSLERFNKKKRRQDLKDSCFFTLFTYRASPMQREFVNALNSVPLLFKNNEEIITSWQTLISHLNTQAKVESWNEKCFELRCKLIAEISKKTSYQKYSINDVKNDIYLPQGYLQNEMLFKSIPTNIEIIAKALSNQTNQTQEIYKKLFNISP